MSDTPETLTNIPQAQPSADLETTFSRIQEELETKLGKLMTWHLSRPPKPGSYNSRLEVWLAPEHDWYPVQIRNTEASGAVTTQTVTKIVLP